jgi:hypothetical protein
MNFIKKLIPAYIEIRSLYWVEYGKRMDEKLERIFKEIDNENLTLVKELISNFEFQFTQSGVPNWIAVKYAQIYRAQSMVNSLI